MWQLPRWPHFSLCPGTSPPGHQGQTNGQFHIQGSCMAALGLENLGNCTQSWHGLDSMSHPGEFTSQCFLARTSGRPVDQQWVGSGKLKRKGWSWVCCQKGKGAEGTRGEAASAPPLSALLHLTRFPSGMRGSFKEHSSQTHFCLAWGRGCVTSTVEGPALEAECTVVAVLKFLIILSLILCQGKSPGTNNGAGRHGGGRSGGGFGGSPWSLNLHSHIPYGRHGWVLTATPLPGRGLVPVQEGGCWGHGGGEPHLLSSSQLWVLTMLGSSLCAVGWGGRPVGRGSWQLLRQRDHPLRHPWGPIPWRSLSPGSEPGVSSPPPSTFQTLALVFLF